MPRRAILAIGGCVAALALTPSLAAASVTVNTTTDSAAPGGCAGVPNDCSLRRAITAAAPGDTVVVPPGAYTLTLGALSITKGLTVQGADAGTTSVTGSGAFSNAFSVGSAAPVTISGLTISAGHVIGPGFGHGGAVTNGTGSVLTLDRDVISGTTLVGTSVGNPIRGAGIANNGILALTNSTVSGNAEQSTASAMSSQGAGVFNTNSPTTATITIVNSTIANNSQQTASGSTSTGAGIANLPGSFLSLESVTISGNSGSANVQNNGTLSALNTIVANGPSGNCAGGLTSQGYNLDSADECGFHATGDQTNANPQLGPLADNGGPTPTLLPAPSSPAVEKGTSSGLGSDQRGQGRPFEIPSIPNAPGGDGADIGAVELQASELPSNQFTATVRGKVLIVSVKAAGGVDVSDARSTLSARQAKKKRKKKQALGLNPSSATGGPPTISVPLSLTKAAKGTLKRKGRVTVNARVRFTPTYGLANTQVLALKVTGKHKRHKR